MNCRSLLTFLATAILLCTVSQSFAAGTIGTSGADFLELAVGSRALGMGEAFTAEPNDINALYFNPAGLGSLKYPELTVFHQELIQDSRLENITISYPIENGFISVANTIFWVPPFEKVDINGMSAGNVQYYNGNLTVGYGYDFEYLYVGLAMKYIYQRIDTYLLHAFAVDVGILKGLRMWTPFEAPIRNFHIGLSVLNLGTNVMDSPLPRSIRLGFSYRPLHWMGLNIDLIENAIDASDLYDFTHGFNESFRLNVGLELSYLEILSIRGGWRFNDVGTYTVGLGFNYVIKNVTFTVDASVADAGDFTPNYSFNVSFKLIPKVVTIQDKRDAEIHYRRGIQAYVADDIESAIREFKTTRDYNPYHRSIDKKIEDLQEIQELKRKIEKEEEEEEEYEDR